MRLLARWTTGVRLCLLGFLLLSTGALAVETLTITARQAVVRAGPDGKSAILTTVPQGATLALIEAGSGGWYRVLLDDGREGWVAQGAARVKAERGIVGRDGAPMVLVPAGTFTMGSNDGAADEKPPHRVELEAFYIDTYEVTNARFQQFVQATQHRTTAEHEGAGGTWRTPRGAGSTLKGLEQHPVVLVDQADAKAYCAWAGKRLPTEAVWEKAARGTDGRRYPWGETFDGKRLNFCDSKCEFFWKDKAVNDGFQYTAPVGSYEGGKSPYGAYDMAGNVWEWVADFYDEKCYEKGPSKDPKGPISGDYVVVHGGGWNNSGLIVRAPVRNYSAPASRHDGVGFRCAMNL